MEFQSQEQLHHVVCRECPLERLSDTTDEAITLKREHATETGHRVVVGRVT